jgi:hypothetical protein
MRRRAQIRSAIKPRYWHTVLCAAASAAVFGVADFAYLNTAGHLPSLKDLWWLVVLVPLVCGSAVTLGCGGASLGKRVVAAAVCGIALGLSYTVVTAVLGYGQVPVESAWLAKSCAWRVFISAVLSTIGALVTELRLPEPAGIKTVSQARLRF